MKKIDVALEVLKTGNITSELFNEAIKIVVEFLKNGEEK